MKFLILLISISLFQNFVFSQNKEIYTVYFETNSFKLQKNELKRLNDFLQKCKNTDFKIFGKPSTRPYRRMAVALAFGQEDVKELVEKAKSVAGMITIE